MPVQNKIFDTYKKIKNAYDSIWDINELTRTLYALVEELYDQHLLEDMHHWLTFHGNIILPNGLRSTFKESYETPGTRERTYLEEDYRWLLTLSVALRVMIPVWGEFIARTKKETGTVFKEYYAYQLLAYSSIAKSEPMERLSVYVKNSIPEEKSRSAAVLGGLSSEDFPTWVLGLVVVRRLCIGDVRGLDPNYMLVTVIYKFIGQKVKGHDNNFIGVVKEKIQEGQNADGENNLSKLEGYKVKQEIPAGDIAIINYYLQDTNAIALKLCPDIDLNLVNLSLANAATLETEQIWKHQVVLVQWVLKPVIPPKGLLHINKQSILKVIGLVQALLWHKGHHELAALVSAIKQPSTDELMLGGGDGRARITKDQIEQLDILFPFSRKPVGKQKVVKRLNPATEAIESVDKMLSEHDWRLTLPPAMCARITGSENNTRYSTPYNTKILLADLAIKLANKSF